MEGFLPLDGTVPDVVPGRVEDTRVGTHADLEQTEPHAIMVSAGKGKREEL
jgi:hypothetical protein